MSVRSIPIYPANLATFGGSWIFGRLNAPFEQPQCPNAIWCDMKFDVHLYFQLIAYLLYQDGYFWRGGRGGGVCRSLIGTRPGGHRIMLSYLSWLVMTRSKVHQDFLCLHALGKYKVTRIIIMFVKIYPTKLPAFKEFMLTIEIVM